MLLRFLATRTTFFRGSLFIRPTSITSQNNLTSIGSSAWLKANGGVNFADKFDITGEQSGILMNRGGVFTKAGRGLDELAQIAEAEGWLPPGSTADVDGGVPQLRDMLQRSMAGERIRPLADQYAHMAEQAGRRADDARVLALENRMRLLGIDPTPARGNADVIRAYLGGEAPGPAVAAAAMQAEVA